MPIDHLLRTVPALKDSVEKAEKVGEADNRHGRAHVRKVHHFKSDLSVEGRQETIHIVVREMDNGRMFYDLNLGGNVGARTECPMGARDLRVESELQISPNTLNISIGGAFDNLSVPSSILSSVSDVVGQILRAHGLDCAVSPSEVRSTSGVPVLGSYRGGEIKVNAGAADPGHAVRHEIIHALRDANLWGQTHGLFTGQEWWALVGAYGDLDAAGQVEKMVAEFYADWSADRAKYPPGPILRAFERILTFFCALGPVLRGEGLIDAAMEMERIANSEIGGRGGHIKYQRGTSQDREITVTPGIDLAQPLNLVSQESSPPNGDEGDGAPCSAAMTMAERLTIKGRVEVVIMANAVGKLCNFPKGTCLPEPL